MNRDNKFFLVHGDRDRIFSKKVASVDSESTVQFVAGGLPVVQLFLYNFCETLI